MTTTKKAASTDMGIIPAKHQQLVEVLKRDGGTTLEEMAILANWLPHSTRAFLTGLKKKGHVVESDKVDGVRRYRIKSLAA